MQSAKIPKLELCCEECGIQVTTLFTINKFFCCKECAESKMRRAKLIQAEKEFETPTGSQNGNE